MTRKILQKTGWAIIALALTALCAVFAACDDGSTNGGDTSGPLEGRWEATETQTDPNEKEYSFIDRYDFSGSAWTEFYSDDNGDFENSAKGTYSVSGSTITFNQTHMWYNGEWVTHYPWNDQDFDAADSWNGTLKDSTTFTITWPYDYTQTFTKK